MCECLLCECEECECESMCACVRAWVRACVRAYGGRSLNPPFVCQRKGGVMKQPWSTAGPMENVVKARKVVEQDPAASRDLKLPLVAQKKRARAQVSNELVRSLLSKHTSE